MSPNPRKFSRLNKDGQKDFLMKRFLNESGDDRDTLSVRSVSSSSSKISSNSNSKSDVSKKVLLQLEEQFLHSDLKRDSFRARTGTRNFVLNPLFEDKSPDAHLQFSTHTHSLKTKNVQNENVSSSNEHDTDCLLEASKKNCVENVFVDLINVRRSNSLRDDDYKPSFIKKRCNSFRRLD